MLRSNRSVPDFTEPPSDDGRMDAVVYGIVLALGLGLAVRLASCGLPCPTSDDAVYRSPAAEFVQNGRLAIPSMGSFLPRSAMIFACYPPVYQLLLSGWYWVLGFSLRSSLAFSFSVHLLNALAVMVATRRVLAAQPDLTALARRATVAAVGLIQVANLAYFDRPEETAFLWIWMVALWGRGARFQHALASGVLVGIAGLTSPWVGILGAIFVTIRTLLTMGCQGEAGSHPFAVPQTRHRGLFRTWGSWHGNLNCWTRTGLRLSATALMAAILVASWVVAMEMMYPGIIDDQFFGVMRHIASNQGPPSFRKHVGQFANTLLYNRPQLLPLVLTLVLFPLLCLRWGWRRVPAALLALFATGVCGIGVVAILRPIAYTYLGAAQMLLVPCFGPAFSPYLRGPPPARRLGLGILALCTTFSFQQATSLVASTWTLPQAERFDEVCHRLTKIIPPGELVDITGRHWYCFQGRNPWYEAYFLRDHREDLLRARWLVLAIGRGKPPCIDAFKLVEEIATTADPDQSYAYSLWRRRGP
jgi:hypothetical protein